MIHYITSSGIGQPWVANELNVVERAGIPIRLHAMRKPRQVHFVSAWADAMNDRTNVLYPLPWLGMVVSLIAAPFLFRGRLLSASANALFASRENLRVRFACIAHLLVACHWGRQLRKEDVSHIHAQWAYSSGTIGMYGAWLTGSTFSFTGHATDLFRDRVALADKIRRAKFIICISEFHRSFYLKEGARPDQLHVAYCGIDTSLFTMSNRVREPGDRYRILSSGRLVEKKGFPDLIAACGILRDRGLDFECVIAGSGPLEQELRDRVSSAKLEAHVEITGEPLNQEHIPEFMHGGDVYCLPCVWATDNDVDGLPQMLMEAMACGCPAISTRLVGIPDLVVDEETGLLVEPRQATCLADALERMAKDPALAMRFRRSGREIIETKFNLDTSLEPLIDQYRLCLSTDAPSDGA